VYTSRHVGWCCRVGWDRFTRVKACDTPEEDAVVGLFGKTATAAAGFGQDEIVVECQAGGWVLVEQWHGKLWWLTNRYTERGRRWYRSEDTVSWCCRRSRQIHMVCLGQLDTLVEPTACS